MSSAGRIRLPSITDMLSISPSENESNQIGNNSNCNDNGVYETPIPTLSSSTMYHPQDNNTTTRSTNTTFDTNTTARPFATYDERNHDNVSVDCKRPLFQFISKKNRLPSPEYANKTSAESISTKKKHLYSETNDNDPAADMSPLHQQHRSRSYSDQYLFQNNNISRRSPTLSPPRHQHNNITPNPATSIYHESFDQTFYTSNNCSNTGSHKRTASDFNSLLRPTTTIVNSHSNRYKCPECSKTFSRPSSLRIHILSHTGEQPHVCPLPGCKRRFSVQSNMRRHLKVHCINDGAFRQHQIVNKIHLQDARGEWH